MIDVSWASTRTWSPATSLTCDMVDMLATWTAMSDMMDVDTGPWLTWTWAW